MSTRVERTGARALLLDPAGRVLLINERVEDGTHWLTPGGGIEPGESAHRAVEREVWEETGVVIEVAPDAPAVFTQRREWSWDGVTYDQTDQFFHVPVPHGLEPRPAAATELELLTLIGHRWWTVDELRASDARFEPAHIADLVEQVRAIQQRRSGRVLLLDESGRVLLIEARVDVGSDRRHWITPGGGVDGEETTLAAAERELFEELGVRARLHPDPVHANREVFSFGGVLYDQRSDYFVARLADGDRITLSGHDELERDTLLGVRWWSAEELRATSEVVWPSGLADLIDGGPAGLPA